MTKKLFLGISLDKQQMLQIGQLQAHFGADVRLVPATNLHMTIAFFGLVSCKTRRKLEKRITALHKPQFSITLDTLSLWRKPRVLCITGQAQDKALLQIANECQLLASTLNLHPSEHIFSAHITLARKAKKMPQCPASQLLFSPLIITPSAIHLFESKSCDNGVEYQILRSWNLH